MEELKTEGELPTELRRAQILAYIKARDFVRVTDLSRRFRVSEVTVRADLDALAERGDVRRIRGGAMPRMLPNIEERPFADERVHEKLAIGRLTASLVTQGETLILDVGTTTTAVAR